MGVEEAFRRAMKRIVIASIGPTCTQTLRQLGLGVDFEPDRGRMSEMVQGLARSANMLLERKRAADAAGVDTSKYRRVDVISPASKTPADSNALQNSPFMRACRREKTYFTPIWIMRQAGRFMREYRDIRAKV